MHFIAEFDSRTIWLLGKDNGASNFISCKARQETVLGTGEYDGQIALVALLYSSDPEPFLPEVHFTCALSQSKRRTPSSAPVSSERITPSSYGTMSYSDGPLLVQRLSFLMPFVYRLLTHSMTLLATGTRIPAGSFCSTGTRGQG